MEITVVLLSGGVEVFRADVTLQESVGVAPVEVETAAEETPALAAEAAPSASEEAEMPAEAPAEESVEKEA